MQATRMFLQLLPEFETKLNVRSTPSKRRRAATDEMTGLKTFSFSPGGHFTN